MDNGFDLHASSRMRCCSLFVEDMRMTWETSFQSSFFIPWIH
jgi:hypothetical protein